MQVKNFFDPTTSTFTYIVIDRTTRYCAIIDAVLNYDPYTGHISTDSAEQIIAYIQENGLTVQWILETHIHADHLTAAHYIKDKIGGKTAINHKIIEVLP